MGASFRISRLSTLEKIKKLESWYPSHNHRSVENGCISNMGFLSFRVIFHLNPWIHGRFRVELTWENLKQRGGSRWVYLSTTFSKWTNWMVLRTGCEVEIHPSCLRVFFLNCAFGPWKGETNMQWRTEFPPLYISRRRETTRIGHQDSNQANF